MLKKKKKIKPREFLRFISRSRSWFQGAPCTQSRRWTAPRRGPGGEPRPGPKNSSAPLQRCPRQTPRASATRLDLVRGQRRILQPPAGVRGGWRQEGRTMKRNRTLNSAVCEVSRENSWDVEPLVRIPECRGCPNSQLGGTEGSAD